MDLKQFTQSIQQIAEEKGIPKEKIVEAIEMALAAAYKRDYGKRGQIVRIKLDPETWKADVRQIKIVVDESMIKSEEEIQAEEEERMRRLSEGESLGKPHEIDEAATSRSRAGKREEQEDEVKEEEVLSGDASGSAEEGKKIRFNPEKHIMLEEAQKINPEAKLGDELEFPLEYHEIYGRIAAQTAKQVIIQRLREVERDVMYDEYKHKEGELVSGVVQRVEARSVFVDLGRAVGVLPPEEQIPYERYRVGGRLKVLITLVEKNPKGPGIFLSRSHPRLLKKLFEIEVPEIASGTVEIKSIAREPGQRSKVAVVSHEPAVDPVGSLVGQKGIRVSTVINELGGEKIDVIEWSEDQAEFVANSLSPAKVLDVEINEKTKEARVIVPEDQQSLAIGKGGQNVRLAAKLTGWKIDVRARRKTGEEVLSEEVSADTPDTALDAPPAESEEQPPEAKAEGLKEAIAAISESRTEEQEDAVKTETKSDSTEESKNLPTGDLPKGEKKSKKRKKEE